MKLTLPLNVPYCQTCAEHVGLRSHQTTGIETLSKAIGFAAAAVGAAVLWGVKGGNLVEAIFPGSSDDKFMAIVATVGPGAAGVLIAEQVLKRRVATTEGGLLPSTHRCTTKLGLALGQPGQKKFTVTAVKGQDDVILRFTCANVEFAARLRELNGAIVEGYSQRQGTLRRTPRGDWVLKS